MSTEQGILDPRTAQRPVMTDYRSSLWDSTLQARMQQAQIEAFQSWIAEQENALEAEIEVERGLLRGIYREIEKLPEFYADGLRGQLEEELEGVESCWRTQLEADIAEQLLVLLHSLGYTVTGSYWSCNLKVTGGGELDEATIALIREFDGALSGAAPQDEQDFTPKGIKALRERERVLKEIGIGNGPPELARHDPNAPVRYDAKQDPEWRRIEGEAG